MPSFKHRPPARRRPLAAATVVLLASVALLAISPARPSARPARITIQTRALAPAGARLLGPEAATASVSGAVVLKPRDDGALRAFIGAASDPGSASFHRYLEPGEFARRFGPTAAAVSAVRAQLRSDGLRVGPTSRDRMIVPFSGTAAAVQTTFQTRLGRYALAGGAGARAPTGAVSLPAEVAPYVSTVLGLDGLAREHRVGPSRPQLSLAAKRRRPRDSAARRQARRAARARTPGRPVACSDARSTATKFHGLTSDEIARAYGANGLYAAGDSGAGQRIAIYELEPFARSDIRTFDECFFGAARTAAMLRRLHVVSVDGGQPRGPGSGEATLDVEAISSIAPGARIDVYTGPAVNADPSVLDSFNEYAAIVDDDRDQVVSTSWGLCEQEVQTGQQGLQEAENYLFQQAAAQGQTIFAAAGDDGSDDCNTIQSPTPVSGQNPVSVDDPASQPYVVGVGGTAIDDPSSPPLEHVWNDGAASGGSGGGISDSWPMPSWQRTARVPGIVEPGSSTYAAANRVERAAGYRPGFCQARLPAATACRLVPDVSAQADDFKGAITVYSHSYVSKSTPTGWLTTGGTSSAAPIWAAGLALVNASPACAAGRATRHGVGFVAPLLYRVASDRSAYRASFNDIRTGSNDIYSLSGGRVFAATPGYDLATGLGSPLLSDRGGAGLAYHLCTLGRDTAGGPAVTGLRPASGPASGGQTIRITGSGFTSHGHPDVTSVQVGTRPVPAGAFAVLGAHAIQLTVPPARRQLPPDPHAAAGGGGPAQVIVTIADGSSSAPGPRSGFTYLRPGAGAATPTVAAITPAGGLDTRPGQVTILGSGFTRAERVTFGGVSAVRFRVKSADRIVATYPRMSRAAGCAALPHTGVYRGESAHNDICQVQVRVLSRGGASPTAPIKPPLEGQIAKSPTGLLKTHGCGCETTPSADEFDYLPRPRLTSVSTSAGAASPASAHGGTVITVRGAGLGTLGIEWADLGNPRRESSVDVGYVYLSGTRMQIVAPRRPVAGGSSRVPLTVRTLAGQSNALTVRYAGKRKRRGS